MYNKRISSASSCISVVSEEELYVCWYYIKPTESKFESMKLYYYTSILYCRSLSHSFMLRRVFIALIYTSEYNIIVKGLCQEN